MRLPLNQWRDRSANQNGSQRTRHEPGGQGVVDLRLVLFAVGRLDDLACLQLSLTSSGRGIILLNESIMGFHHDMVIVRMAVRKVNLLSGEEK